jgi:predicted RNase H-like HicB family nuclease
MLKAPETAYNNIRGDVMYTTFKVTIYPCIDTAGYRAVCKMPNGGANTMGDTIQDTQRNMYESMDLFLEDDYPEIKEYSLEFEVRNA